MFPRDYLKVLSNLKTDCCINIAELSRQTELSERQVKQAIKYLKNSALIDENGSGVKILVNRLN
jgi:hypothetical protein